MVLSLALSLVVLVVFRYTSNQKAIARAKDRVFAHLMELRLFPDDPRTTLKSLGQLMIWNTRYVLASMRPALLLALPVSLLFVHLQRYYEWRPLRPGETTTVTMKLVEGLEIEAFAPTLVAHGVAVETAPVRVSADNAVSWRVRALDSGVHTLDLRLGDTVVSKTITVAENTEAVTPRRMRGWWAALWHPGEPAIAQGSVEWIEVDYPAAASLNLWGMHTHWLVFVLLLSFLAVLALRRPLGVEV